MSNSPNAGIKVSKPSSSYLLMARNRTLNKIATVLSGELENVGTPIKRVIICNQGRACTDGETVWIPAKVHEDDAINRIAQEAILAHEAAGHLRYTDFGAWKSIGDEIKRGDTDRMLHDFVNILEDARVNHLLSQDFAGSGKRLDATQAIFMARHEQAWADKTVEEIVPRQAAMVAMMSEAIAGKPHFFNHIPEVVAYMDEVRTICATAIGQPNTKAVIKQAKRMLAIYRKHFSENAEDDEDTFGMPSGEDGEGVMTDDMSPKEIEKMAKKQSEKNAKPEEVSRQRFNDLKKKMDELAEESKEAQKKASKANEDEEGDDSTSDANDGSESDENGEESEGNGDGADGDGEEGDEDAGDSDSSGDADGEGEGEGEGQGESGEGDSDSDSDGEASHAFNEGEGEDEPCNDGESDEMGSGGDRGWNQTEMDELWADTQAAMDDEYQDALDLKNGFDSDVDNSKDKADIISPVESSNDGSGHDCRITHTTESFVERGAVDIEELAESFHAVIGQNKSAITTMVNELKRTLKGDNSKHERGLKRGMLDGRKLAYHQTNSRLFMKKNEPKKAVANVIILVDSSGSMGGSRCENAAQTACVFAEVFDKLNFGCEIVDFASSGNSTAMRIRKQMNAPLNQITKAAIRQPTAGGSNADGYAVQWCLNRLEPMSGNRMLFVISDGQPAGPCPPTMNCDEHLIHVVSNANKDIGLFSVGIDGMDTSAYYPNAVRVNNSKNLIRESMPVIRKMVRTIKNKA